VEGEPAKSRADGKYVVARARDIPEGSRLLVTVQGREIGIYNIDGQFHAVLNRCPHRGAALCRGDVIGLITSTGPGEIYLDTSRKFIVCPWHGWEFDINTGKSWYQAPDGRSRGFRTARPVGIEVKRGSELTDELSDGATEVADGEGAVINAATHRIEGPYRAELYPVEHDDEYVVVSLRRISALSGPPDGPPPPTYRSASAEA
jgi:nitrite reductase/ring-hydroxylating ferredoxin subunit